MNNIKTYLPVALTTGCSGGSGLQSLFPEFKGKFRIDDSVREFLDFHGPDYRIKKDIIFTPRREEVGGVYGELMKSRGRLFRDQALAIISYLGHGGWNLLEIPDGEDEMNVIVGPFRKLYHAGDVALLVEYEGAGEDGPEIHLHERSLLRRIGGPLIVLDLQ